MDRHPEHHQVDVLKHLVIIMWVIAVKRWQVFWYFGFARGAIPESPYKPYATMLMQLHVKWIVDGASGYYAPLYRLV